MSHRPRTAPSNETDPISVSAGWSGHRGISPPRASGVDDADPFTHISSMNQHSTHQRYIRQTAATAAAMKASITNSPNTIPKGTRGMIAPEDPFVIQASGKGGSSIAKAVTRPSSRQGIVLKPANDKTRKHISAVYSLESPSSSTITPIPSTTAPILSSETMKLPISTSFPSSITRPMTAPLPITNEKDKTDSIQEGSSTSINPIFGEFTDEDFALFEDNMAVNLQLLGGSSLDASSGILEPSDSFLAENISNLDSKSHLNTVSLHDDLQYEGSSLDPPQNSECSSDVNPYVPIPPVIVTPINETDNIQALGIAEASSTIPTNTSSTVATAGILQSPIRPDVTLKLAALALGEESLLGDGLDWQRQNRVFYDNWLRDAGIPPDADPVNVQVLAQLQNLLAKARHYAARGHFLKSSNVESPERKQTTDENIDSEDDITSVPTDTKPSTSGNDTKVSKVPKIGLPPSSRRRSTLSATPRNPSSGGTSQRIGAINSARSSTRSSAKSTPPVSARMNNEISRPVIQYSEGIPTDEVSQKDDDDDSYQPIDEETGEWNRRKLYYLRSLTVAVLDTWGLLVSELGGKYPVLAELRDALLPVIYVEPEASPVASRAPSARPTRTESSKSQKPVSVNDTEEEISVEVDEKKPILPNPTDGSSQIFAEKWFEKDRALRAIQSSYETLTSECMDLRTECDDLRHKMSTSDDRLRKLSKKHELQREQLEKARDEFAKKDTLWREVRARYESEQRQTAALRKQLRGQEQEAKRLQDEIDERDQKLTVEKRNFDEQGKLLEASRRLVGSLRKQRRELLVELRTRGEESIQQQLSQFIRFRRYVERSNESIGCIRDFILEMAVEGESADAIAADLNLPTEMNLSEFDKREFPFPHLLDFDSSNGGEIIWPTLRPSEKLIHKDAEKEKKGDLSAREKKGDLSAREKKGDLSAREKKGDLSAREKKGDLSSREKNKSADKHPNSGQDKVSGSKTAVNGTLITGNKDKSTVENTDTVPRNISIDTEAPVVPQLSVPGTSPHPSVVSPTGSISSSVTIGSPIAANGETKSTLSLAEREVEHKALRDHLYNLLKEVSDLPFGYDHGKDLVESIQTSIRTLDHCKNVFIDDKSTAQSALESSRRDLEVVRQDHKAYIDQLMTHHSEEMAALTSSQTAIADAFRQKSIKKEMEKTMLSLRIKTLKDEAQRLRTTLEDTINERDYQVGQLEESIQIWKERDLMYSEDLWYENALNCSEERLMALKTIEKDMLNLQSQYQQDKIEWEILLSKEKKTRESIETRYNQLKEEKLETENRLISKVTELSHQYHTLSLISSDAEERSREWLGMACEDANGLLDDFTIYKRLYFPRKMYTMIVQTDVRVEHLDVIGDDGELLIDEDWDSSGESDCDDVESTVDDGPDENLTSENVLSSVKPSRKERRRRSTNENNENNTSGDPATHLRLSSDTKRNRRNFRIRKGVGKTTLFDESYQPVKTSVQANPQAWEYLAERLAEEKKNVRRLREALMADKRRVEMDIQRAGRILADLPKKLVAAISARYNDSNGNTTTTFMGNTDVVATGGAAGSKGATITPPTTVSILKSSTDRQTNRDNNATVETASGNGHNSSPSVRFSSSTDVLHGRHRYVDASTQTIKYDDENADSTVLFRHLPPASDPIELVPPKLLRTTERDLQDITPQFANIVRRHEKALAREVGLMRVSLREFCGYHSRLKEKLQIELQTLLAHPPPPSNPNNLAKSTTGIGTTSVVENLTPSESWQRHFDSLQSLLSLNEEAGWLLDPKLFVRTVYLATTDDPVDTATQARLIDSYKSSLAAERHRPTPDPTLITLLEGLVSDLQARMRKQGGWKALLLRADGTIDMDAPIGVFNSEEQVEILLERVTQLQKQGKRSEDALLKLVTDLHKRLAAALMRLQEWETNGTGTTQKLLTDGSIPFGTSGRGLRIGGNSTRLQVDCGVGTDSEVSVLSAEEASKLRDAMIRAIHISDRLLRNPLLHLASADPILAEEIRAKAFGQRFTVGDADGLSPVPISSTTDIANLDGVSTLLVNNVSGSMPDDALLTGLRRKYADAVDRSKSVSYIPIVARPSTAEAPSTNSQKLLKPVNNKRPGSSTLTWRKQERLVSSSLSSLPVKSDMSAQVQGNKLLLSGGITEWPISSTSLEFLPLTDICAVLTSASEAVQTNFNDADPSLSDLHRATTGGMRGGFLTDVPLYGGESTNSALTMMAFQSPQTSMVMEGGQSAAFSPRRLESGDLLTDRTSSLGEKTPLPLSIEDTRPKLSSKSLVTPNSTSVPPTSAVLSQNGAVFTRLMQPNDAIQRSDILHFATILADKLRDSTKETKRIRTLLATLHATHDILDNPNFQAHLRATAGGNSLKIQSEKSNRKNRGKDRSITTATEVSVSFAEPLENTQFPSHSISNPDDKLNINGVLTSQENARLEAKGYYAKSLLPRIIPLHTEGNGSVNTKFTSPIFED